MSSNFNNTTPAAPAGGINVKWQTDSAGNNSAYVNGGAGAGVNAQTVNYTAVAGDSGKLISMNSGSAITLTLPSSPPSATWFIEVENIGAGTLTVSRNGLNIDGAASNLTLAQNSGVVIYTDGSNYFTQRGFAGGSGVTSLNALTGALSIVAGANITVTPAGSNITIAASGGGSSTPVIASLPLYDSVFIANTAGGMTKSYGSETWTNLGTVFNSFTASTTTVATYTTFQSSAAANPNGGFSTSDSGQFYIWSPANFSIQMEWIANLSQVSDVLYYAGYFDRSLVGGTFGGTTVASTVRGVYFRFDTSASDTKIQCVTGNGTSNTVTSSGISADANSHCYAIYHNSAKALFFIDGVQVANISTTLPTSSPNPGWQISASYVTTVCHLGMTAMRIGIGV